MHDVATYGQGNQFVPGGCAAEKLRVLSMSSSCCELACTVVCTEDRGAEMKVEWIMHSPHMQVHMLHCACCSSEQLLWY